MRDARWAWRGTQGYFLMQSTNQLWRGPCQRELLGSCPTGGQSTSVAKTPEMGWHQASKTRWVPGGPGDLGDGLESVCLAS